MGLGCWDLGLGDRFMFAGKQKENSNQHERCVTPRMTCPTPGLFLRDIRTLVEAAVETSEDGVCVWMQRNVHTQGACVAGVVKRLRSVAFPPKRSSNGPLAAARPTHASMYSTHSQLLAMPRIAKARSLESNVLEIVY